MRIGELARRTGVSEHVLRVWERRYALLDPQRTPGGYRTYTERDEARVRAVAALREEGVSAAEAARRVLADDRLALAPRADPLPSDAAGDPALLVAALHSAVDTYDEAAGQAVLDRAFTAYPPEDLVHDVFLPFLHQLGERWEAGEVSVAQEHFASSLLRRRLSALTLTWGQGNGAIAVLACPPGERHDLGLQLFGVILGRAGWRVRFLGSDTPVETVAEAAAGASVILLSAIEEARFLDVAAPLRALAREHHVVLAGSGATSEVGERLGIRCAEPDMTLAAKTISALVGGRG